MDIQRVSVNEIQEKTKTSSVPVLDKDVEFHSEFGRDALGIDTLGRSLISNKNCFEKYQEMPLATFKKLLLQKPYIKNEDKIGTFDSLFRGRCWGSSPNERVNYYLRTGAIPDEKGMSEEGVKDTITSAHFAMEQSKLPQDTLLYRSVANLDFIPEKGEIFTEKGFTSTSIRTKYAKMYGGKDIIIYAPKGTPCIANGSFMEVLLKDGTQFEVLSKDENHAILMCKDSKPLTEQEKSDINDYSKKVELYSDGWIKKYSENNYWNLK